MRLQALRPRGHASFASLLPCYAALTTYLLFNQKWKRAQILHLD